MNKLPRHHCFHYFLILGALAAMSGCQNGVMGPTRIPAPATYSIGQNTYYNANSQASSAAGAVVDPHGIAPTPAAGSGWQPSGQASPNVTPGGNQPRSADQQNFSLSANTPTFGNAGAGPVAAASATTGGQATAFNANDPTRVPVSDATGVRAPARYQNPYSQTPTQVAQTGFQNGSANRYPPANPAAVAPRTYMGNPQIAGGPVPYRGQPIYTRPDSSVNGVLAESTVRMDPNSRNYQAGWRDREPGSEIMR